MKLPHCPFPFHKTNLQNRHFAFRQENISLSLTVLLACFIILAGYRLLDLVGDYFIMADDRIILHTNAINDSYTFYSQSDNDIILFPWAYYNENSTSFYEYILNFDQLHSGNSIELKDYLDVHLLYEELHYNFYHFVSDIRPVIEKMNTTLYDLMDFDNMMNDLSVTKINNRLFLFYRKELLINEETYLLSFAADNKLRLLSFECKKQEDNDFTQIEHSLAKNRLTKLVNSNYCDCMSLLIHDILYRSGILKDYRVHNTFSGDYTFALDALMITELQNNYEIEITNVDSGYMYEDDQESIPGSDETSDESENTGSNQSSPENTASAILLDKEYLVLLLDTIFAGDTTLSDINKYLNQKQIIERNDELLVIIPDNNLVLHYDPYNNLFTGFNKIYE